MNRITRPDGLVLDSQTADAHPSFNVNRASMSPSLSTMSIPSVNPEPAYIAPAAAANIVTGEIVTEFQMPMYDERGNDIDGASVAPASLTLVNQFLDRLLFNFLSCARSTSLASLRPAIVEVLKPRLAKEAIAGADEELQEYLGGDDEELNSFHNGQDVPMDWDLDLVWKRARLRCMVYTRLGDMEEEDEEMYIEQENLEDLDSIRRVSRDIGIVSPAVAIFLTSILEFVGEHALMVAGQAAYKRIETKAKLEARGPLSFQKVVVEEMDMEKVALNPTLGRLWRSWRKILRSPRDSSSSRAYFRGGMSLSRKGSTAGTSEILDREPAQQASSVQQGQVPSVAEVLDPSTGVIEPDQKDLDPNAETVDSEAAHSKKEAPEPEKEAADKEAANEPDRDPSDIPLPMGEYDIDEIEVPGYSAARALMAQAKAAHPRPFSLLLSRDYINARIASLNRPEEKEASEDAEDTVTPNQTDAPVLEWRKGRSQSLPPTPTPFEIHTDAESDAAFETPDEEFSSRHAEVERVEQPPTPTPAPRKPLSAPNTPSYSAVLTVLSQHVARELEASPLELGAPTAQELAASTLDHRRSALREPSEADPAEGALRFDGNDYIINDQERAAIESTEKAQVSPLYPTNDTSFLDVDDHGDSEVSRSEVSQYSPSSSLRDRSDTGHVSPIEPISEHSGQVSPLDFVDEDRVSQADGPLGSDIDTPVAHQSQHQVSPLFDQPEIFPAAESKVPSSTGYRQLRNDTMPENGVVKDEKREMFVLPKGSPTQQIRPASDSSSLSGKDLQADGSISKRNNRRVSPEMAVATAPPLTPLREMTDAAYDSSDSVSLIAPTYKEPQNRYPPRSEPLANISAPRGGAVKRQVSSPYSTPGVDKAAVQRVSPTPGNSQDSTVPANRLSGSSSRDSRGVSGFIKPSLSTRGKNRVVSGGDGYRESVVSRMSNDGSRIMEDGFNGRSSMSTSDTQKNFEQLINSGETIQYTLTPQNMRAIETRDSFQLNPAPPPKQSGALRDERPSYERNSSHKSRGQSFSNEVNINGYAANAAEKGQGQPRSGTVAGSGAMTKRVSQARDARVGSDNTKDFADFIRSTGPVGADSQAITSLPPVSTRSSQIAKENGRIRTTKGPRLQAREPIVRANEQGDLINFLRQGPPADKTSAAGAGAGPGTGAGVRTGSRVAPPVDSMQTRARDTYSVASTQDSFVSKSIQSSTGSRTALLDSHRAKAAAANAAQNEKRPHRVGEDSDDVMPKRTRRAPRDPYAIDTDSEEEPEMSIGEFLDSQMPPPASEDNRRVTSPPTLAKPGAKLTSRKPSNAGKRVISRMGSSKTVVKADGQPPPPPSKSPLPQSSSSPIYAAQTAGRAPRLPVTNGNGFSNGSTVSTDTIGRAPLRSNPAGAGAGPKARLKARDEREEGGSSRELADFFRASSPPPGMMIDEKLSPMTTGGSGTEKEKGFSRLFGQRKKSTAGRFG